MTTNETTPRDGENVTDASMTNYNAQPADGGPVTFAQIRTGRFARETVFGQGAEAEVVVDGGDLELTLTVDGFDDAADLLDRDILSVVLCAKDIDDGDE